LLCTTFYAAEKQHRIVPKFSRIAQRCQAESPGRTAGKPVTWHSIVDSSESPQLSLYNKAWGEAWISLSGVSYCERPVSCNRASTVMAFGVPYRGSR